MVVHSDCPPWTNQYPAASSCLWRGIISFLNVSFVSDVFKQGIWKEVAAIDDPELCELAGALPSLALQGKAPSTVKKYSGAFVGGESGFRPNGLFLSPSRLSHCTSHCI